MEEFTYILKSNELYNIGSSPDPKETEKEFLIYNPHVRLVTYGRGAKCEHVKYQYKKKWVMGAWFELSDKDVVACVKSIKDGSIVGQEVMGKRNGLSELSPEYLENLDYVINFGKYKGHKLCTMTGSEEISWLKWFLNKSKWEKGKPPKKNCTVEEKCF